MRHNLIIEFASYLRCVGSRRATMGLLATCWVACGGGTSPSVGPQDVSTGGSTAVGAMATGGVAGSSAPVSNNGGAGAEQRPPGSGGAISVGGGGSNGGMTGSQTGGTSGRGGTGTGGANVVGTGGASGAAGGRGGSSVATVDAAATPVDLLPATDVFIPMGSASPEIPVPMPIVDACRKFAQVLCDQQKKCQPLGYASNYSKDEECLLVSDRECRVVMGAPGAGDTPTTRQICTDSITAQICEDRAARGLPAACDVNRGSIAPGSVCRSTTQCTVGHYCGVSAESLAATPGLGSGFRCGRCVPRAEIGKDCNIISPSSCVDGASCVSRGGITTLGVCLRNKILGEACTLLDACQGTVCQQGVCALRTLSNLGESCVSQACSTSGDIFCNRLNNRCEARPPLAKQGEYCGALQDGSNRVIACVGGLACSGVAVSGFANTCVPRSGFGQPCGLGQYDPRCTPGMFCLNGSCVWAEPAGCM